MKMRRRIFEKEMKYWKRAKNGEKKNIKTKTERNRTEWFFLSI